MVKPDLTHLRELLGDAWVDAKVFGEKPSHLLGRWQKKDPTNIWLKYTGRLIKAILTRKNIVFNRKILADKLKSDRDSVSTLAEMESATYLAEQDFTVTLEPTAVARDWRVGRQRSHSVGAGARGETCDINDDQSCEGATSTLSGLR